MKKKACLLLISVLIAALLLGACAEEESAVLTEFSINGYSYTMERGDELHTGAWNGQETRFNDVLFVGAPVIRENITIGTDYRTVLDSFGIGAGYAYVDIEVGSEAEDGTSELVSRVYEDADVFAEDYLCLCISFGYKKENGAWRLIHCDELENGLYGEVLTYSIEFNGMSGQAVDPGKVIAFSVVYQ